MCSPVTSVVDAFADTVPPPAPKGCACGATHDHFAWARLPLVAASWEGLELRNCRCGSTLAVEVAS